MVGSGRRVLVVVFTALLAAACITVVRSVGSTPPKVIDTDGRAAASSLAVDELAFAPNVGQAPPSIRFIARTPGTSFGFTRRSVILGDPVADTHAPRLRFLGVQTDAVPPRALNPLPGVTNYLLGNDPRAWQTNVPTFGAIQYPDLYPGVDVSFHANHAGQLEFDLLVEGGADPGSVNLGIAGDDAILGSDGGVEIRRGQGLQLSPPVAYQLLNAQRREVPVWFTLNRASLRLAVGPYDHDFPLLIDPVIAYSTYLGGSGYDDVIYTALGDDGSFYVTGVTGSSDLPVTRGTFQQHLSGRVDAFVTKIDPTGTSLEYSTYLGGPRLDVAIGLDVGADGAAYVVGLTASHRFPTTKGGYQRHYNGGPDDAFVTKLDPTGSSIEYSTFLGGSGDDLAFIAPVDDQGNVYVEGWTGSHDFPVTDGAFQHEYGGGKYDAFSTKLDPSGSIPEYSTFIGGTGNDGGWDGDLDAQGRIHLTGSTDSRDFPTTPGAFQPRYGGGRTDAYVTVLDATGSALVSSTYIGGKRYEEVADLTVDANGDSYVPGTTTSKDFPTTPSALQGSSGGGKNDGYLVELNAEGTLLEYGTYVGGAGDDTAGSVRVNDGGEAVMSGMTSSTDFPVTSDAFQPRFGGGPNDAFVLWLDLGTSSLRYSSYLGGMRDDGSSGAGLGLASDGTATVPGFTTSANFPTTPGAFQRRPAGSNDIFVFRITLES
jgi:hypothetical protein